MDEKICSIVCGAPCERLDVDDITGLVIAADKGLEYLLREGITPDIAVGDFDSAGCPVPDGVECIRVSPIKDDTDAQLAADTAIEHGCTRLRFFCALGGRLDHTLANIQMLYGLLLRGISAELYGGGEKAYLLSGGEVCIKRYVGYLSVFSFGDSTVISEAGVKYPLQRHSLSNSFPLGVSNEIEEDFARICVHEGTALIIEHYGMD